MAMDDDTKKLIEEIREKNQQVGRLAEKLTNCFTYGLSLKKEKILNSVSEIDDVIGKFEKEASSTPDPFKELRKTNK